MRPTNARFSDMPGPRTWSVWWGDKTNKKQKGIIQYTVSPFRQRAAYHFARNYLFNFYTRTATHFPYFIVPFSLGYAIYTWGNRQYAWQNSKAGHIAQHGGH